MSQHVLTLTKLYSHEFGPFTEMANGSLTSTFSRMRKLNKIKNISTPVFSHVFVSFFLQLILWTHRCRLRPSALRVFVCACICRLKNQKDNAADVFNTEQHSKTPLQHPYNNSQQPLNSRSHVWLYFSFQLCNMTHWFFQPPQSVQHTKEDCCSLLFPLLLPRISSSRLFWTGVAVKGVILTLNGGSRPLKKKKKKSTRTPVWALHTAPLSATEPAHQPWRKPGETPRPLQRRIRDMTTAPSPMAVNIFFFWVCFCFAL